MAVVEGRLQIREWTDKEGGNRTSAEVVVESMYFADSKRQENSAPTQDTAPPIYNNSNDFEELEEIDGDLPFCRNFHLTFHPI